MKLGFARKDITPSFPVSLAGYMVNNAAGRISEGVHDKLYARVIFFDDPRNGPFVLLQLDLLCLDELCVEKIRAAFRDSPAAGRPLEKENILICAAHTHSGFGGIFDLDRGINRQLVTLFGKENPVLVDMLVERCVEALSEAAGNCVETTVRMNRGTLTGLGTNRRRADLPCDTSLFIMEFLRFDRKKILLYNLACHPTVMNGENRLISADFPGFVAGKLEDIPEAYDMVVFVNGSAGDMSTRFTRNESSFDECNRYANIIVESINRIKKGVFFPLEKAKLRYFGILLKKAAVPDPQSAEDALQKARQTVKDLEAQNADTAALRKAASFVEGAEISLLKSRASAHHTAAPEKTVEIGILRINGTSIVCSPFELFSTLALVLKEKKAVECFGYVNAHEGYLADSDAWDNLDYEALLSDYDRGEGERYIELISLLV